MSLEDDVVAVFESAQDKLAAAGLVVRMIRAAVALEAAEEQREVEWRVREERREAERVRKAAYRERLSRDVPGTPVDSQGQTGTKRDTVSPLDPPSSPSLSLLPDPERAIPLAPALLVFPVVGKAVEWGVTQELLDQHQAAFPALDVMAEYRRCLAWLQSNPDRKKTPRGMPAALFRWLTRAQESGKGIKRQATAKDATGASASGLAAYCEWHRDARNDRKPANRPRETCPSCKHLKAAERTRDESTELALGVGR